MAEELIALALRDDFYKNKFHLLMIAMSAFVLAIIAVVSLSLYLYMAKPLPVTFKVDKEMRVQAPVSLSKPYLSTPDLIQWVTDVLPKVFVLDFNYYDTQLEASKPYFSAQGWHTFKNQLNIYANFNTIQANKLFVTCEPSAAPYILRDGILQETGKYGWWVQVPLTLKYDGLKPLPNKEVIFQVLVVRVSTLNNLVGVEIDNIIQAPEKTG